jgi:acetyltransferase-like isoleucine patch superfamily enzyme
MFATDTCLLCGDGHTIKNKKTEEVINFADSIEIGNHCWIGKFSNILKNSKVAEGCIVGMSTNVTASVIASPNSIIAGNPAKVIKTNIEWERTSPSVYKTDLDANQ